LQSLVQLLPQLIFLLFLYLAFLLGFHLLDIFLWDLQLRNVELLTKQFQLLDKFGVLLLVALLVLTKLLLQLADGQLQLLVLEVRVVQVLMIIVA